MEIANEADIERLVRNDPWMMEVLEAAEDLGLPDWWIGAGFLRNRVWDAIQGNAAQPSKDVDLVYFDAHNTAPETDWAYDERLKNDFPFAEWEVRNQARMHYVNGYPPYSSTADGIAHWIETATCVAVKLDRGKLTFLFCYGTDDLLGLVARPTPYTRAAGLMPLFRDRINQKQWRKKWPQLQVVED